MLSNHEETAMRVFGVAADRGTELNESEFLLLLNVCGIVHGASLIKIDGQISGFLNSLDSTIERTKQDLEVLENRRRAYSVIRAHLKRILKNGDFTLPEE